MKRLLFSILLIAAFSTATISCRDTKKSDDVEDVADDAEDMIEDATDDDASDPVENTIQEGVNEVQENTGLGGEDDA